MSTAGIELITRNSLNSLRHVSQTSNYLQETLNSQPVDDRSWSWGYLRRQFRIKNLDELYSSYQQRLQHGYFSVFLVLQIVVSVGHISAVVALDGLVHTLPDVVCYVLVMLLCVPLVWVLVQEKRIEDYPWVPFASSCVVIVAMVATDLTLTLYHSLRRDEHTWPPTVVRPSFTTHSLLACYMFLPLTNNVQVLILGATISLCHLVTLGTVVYEDQHRLWHKLASDAVYLTCVNFHGLYFRLLNEISLRRTFLDRRACVEATHKLEYEKRQEEHLLLSILPRHIVDSVRDDIRRIIQDIDHPHWKEPFSDMYVKEHYDVSILYADVVNYSQLTISLPVQKLVEVLNELFGRFDDACEEHGVLRIKFLGDCYNCVSGIPTANVSHARSCVRLGLDMISIIKDVREVRKLNDRLNMRIGVHSGKVLSGLLGVCKWQYDIWSQDAIIANHMEQAGIPGHVHITKDTLSLLGNEFAYKPAHGYRRNKFLEKHNIETFLIVQNEARSDTKIERQANGSNNSGERISFSRRISNGNVRRLGSSRILTHQMSSIEVANPINSRRRMAFMDNNLYRYQQTLKIADEQMAEAIRNMPVGVYHRWMFRQTNINPLFLNFDNLAWEMPFLKQPDPLFKFYIISSLAGVFSMMIIQALGSTSHWLTWTVFGFVVGCLLALLPLTWSHYMWNKLEDPHQDVDVIEKPRWALPRLLYAASLRVMWRYELRFVLYLLLCTLLTSCAIIELVECGMDLERNQNALNASGPLNRTVLEENHWLDRCLAPWNVTESCMLVMIISFMFLRIHFLLKLLVCLIIFAVYTYGIWLVNPQLFAYGETMNPGMPPAVAHTLCILFLGTALHLLDRQTEYINRLDYKWKRQLSDGQEEGAITHMVNKMLLENILPTHVAKLYLNTNRAYGELYHEEYESVAVMFATITDYALFNEEEEEFSQLSYLIMLNHIICDIDKLLFEPCFLRVEKIKMAGWTYMAACGLDSGRRDSTVSAAKINFSEHVVVVMARFAATMMRVLKENNRETLQNFRLRVGICHGEVTAGVVGAQKPLYDIWGDAVNMASRMDSTGEPGKIQVTEETAAVLEEQNISCQCRGLTYVKGKGDMVTYFVDMDENFTVLESKSPVLKTVPRINEENTRL